MTDEDLETLRELHQAHNRAMGSGDYQAMLEANVRWHFHLYDIARTKYLRDIIERLWCGVRWGDRWVSPQPVEESLDQHEEIMEAITARDAQRAGDLMAAHIRSGKQRQLAHRRASGSDPR